MRLPTLTNPANVVAWSQQLDRTVGPALERNRGGTFTLAANVTTTTVSDGRARKGMRVLGLTAQTANAAAALTTTYVSAVADGSFTVTHANNAQTDRTFTYYLV